MIAGERRLSVQPHEPPDILIVRCCQGKDM